VPRFDGQVTENIIVDPGLDFLDQTLTGDVPDNSVFVLHRERHDCRTIAET
jgi:hypothetical protein